MRLGPLPEPVAEVPRLFGAPAPGGLAPWSDARERLAAARNLWIGVVDDGRPHSRPVWTVWLAEGLAFSTGSPALGRAGDGGPMTATTESGDAPVILQGTGVRALDPDLLRRFVDALNRKYDWHASATAEGMADAEGNAGPVFVLRPSVAFGWGSDMASPTRWRFASWVRRPVPASLPGGNLLSMAEYAPPLDEIRFVLEHVAGIDELSKLGGFEHADVDSTMAVLEEFGRFVVDKVLPTNRVGDEEGSHVGGDPADPTVITPSGFKEAYAQYVASGWGTVPFDPAYGGGGFPWTVGVAMQELLNSGNVAFAMAPLLTQGALDMLATHGSEADRERYLPKMVSGEWTGTMNLTEPDAGSDVGAVRTRAVPAGDGSFRITGTKIYISFGEHDLTENIIHLVLARTPGSPPGTKGISCFIVPKHLVEDDGTLGRRNGVKVVSVEHKMGIRASPTCVLEYDDAVGYLVGEENAGMRYMFTMMNNARLSVGVEGLGLCEAAWQRARTYARERQQGRAPGSTEPRSAIVEHADVRRMLLTMKASTEALRALHYFDARQIDLGHNHPDEAERAAATELAGLLTPLSKGWGTDLANEITSLGIQVFGGMGYIEETGVAQLYRDARIMAIYEGTNGIQAMDLVGRKLPLRGGAVVAELVARMRATAEELRGAGELASLGERLADGLGVLQQATDWILANGAGDPVQALAAATPYLRLFSQVVGAWLLGVEALAAARTAPASLPPGFAAAKVATARFFADHILPTVHGLLPTIVAGKADLFAVEL